MKYFKFACIGTMLRTFGYYTQVVDVENYLIPFTNAIKPVLSCAIFWRTLQKHSLGPKVQTILNPSKPHPRTPQKFLRVDTFSD